MRCSIRAFGACVLLLLVCQAHAQTTRFQLPVLAQADTLRAAWAGGLSAPQFSVADLNADGLPDLVVGDRADARILTFLNTGRSGKLRYRYDDTYRRWFPQFRTRNWFLLRDYNGDGLPDLFADSLNSTQVWTNLGRNPDGSFRWQRRYPVLQSLDEDNVTRPVYTANADLDAFTDIDGDGDLDILAWDVLGLNVAWYRNMGVEALGRTDTLLMQKGANCWGNFREAFNPADPLGGYTAQLGVTGCYVATPKSDHEGGGAILPLNLNGDSLTDVLISDTEINYAIALINGGTRRVADMVSVSGPFPASQSIRVERAPALYYEDVDGDAVPDLLASPNSFGRDADTASVWRYHNAGTASQPVFQLQERDFLQNTMLDLGSRAYPAIADVNRDGLLDVVVGVEFRFEAPGRFRAGLTLLQNIGSVRQPVLSLVTRDWLVLSADASTSQLVSLAPAFGDLDGDGDADLLLAVFDPATNRPALLRYRQLSGGQFELLDANFLTASTLGQFGLAPTLSDIDQDGDLDLVLGTQSGRLILYENTGTSTEARFSLVSTTWGGADLRDPIQGVGQARPFIADLNADGRPDLLVGTAGTTLRRFTNLSLSAGTLFTELPPIADVSAAFSAPALGNLFQSDTLAMLVGTRRGGVTLATLPARLFDQPNTTGDLQLDISPNPTSGLLKVTGPAGTHLRLIDLLGRTVLVAQLPTEGTLSSLTLRLTGLESAVYILQGDLNGRKAALRVMLVSGE